MSSLYYLFLLAVGASQDDNKKIIGNLISFP